MHSLYELILQSSAMWLSTFRINQLTPFSASKKWIKRNKTG
jgi:hypothetical protein